MALLEKRRALVLTAEPGAGKSTLVPPFLLDASWLGGRKIVMLEPRRLAAAAVAARIADLLGEPLGRRAGFRVRSASRVSKETRIEVVTEALLTRGIQEDPLLKDVGLVIFDEFHERSIHADLALALTLEVQRARRDLSILLMSATIDEQRLAAFLGGAPVLSCPGKAFPVETRYWPAPAGVRWEAALAAAVPLSLDGTEGDVLVFLPGVPEIRRLSARLGGALAGRAALEVLHGSLPLEEQRRVLAPRVAGTRRVILATSIAETSLTVPGVRVVADSGWARISRFHPSTGMDRLVTEKVSAAAAEQRRGRAARLGPGVCLRLWKESEDLLPHPEPEILRSDLAGLVLECVLWGALTPDRLRWLDPPPLPAWDKARELLAALRLLDSPAGRPTPLGREVAALGLSPRLGALVREGSRRGLAPLAAACAALLEDRDGSAIRDDPDLRLRLEMVRKGSGGGQSWRGGMEREAARILKRARHEGASGWSAAEEETAGGLLAFAFPDRVARREPDGSYRFPSGRAARLPPATLASRAAGAWIVAPDTDAGDSIGTVRLTAPLRQEEAEKALEPVTVESVEIRWKGLTPQAVSLRKAGRLLLGERPGAVTAEAVAASLSDRLSREGLGVLPWDERCRVFLERLRFFAGREPQKTDRAGGPGRDLSDAALAATAAEWLEPHLTLGGGPVITSNTLLAALGSILGPRRRELERSVPESLTLPGGRRRKLDYSTGAPVVEARIQEVFGLAKSPLICGVPVVFHLLSPAGRPLQVTSDLAGFWKGSYAEVRKQMRGRYPKHHWPEDPMKPGAQTAGGRRTGGRRI